MSEWMAFHEVDHCRWRDLEQLFEARGGPKYCWCMVWRRMPRGTHRSDSGAKKETLKRLVEDDTPIGILGYVNGEPVAWCSIAPANTYRELGDSNYPVHPTDSVWSIACFFLPRRFRGQGLTRHLILAALEHAGKKGATIVEAYPVDPESPSYKFMGLVPTFEKLGFKKVGAAGTRRHVMRLFL